MNVKMEKPLRLLIADDDKDDIQITRDCFIEYNLPIFVREVNDGQLLMDHLESFMKNPDHLPQLIILDLNMPKKSGLEALKEIKEHAIFRKIPVVVFSTSKAVKDIEKSYELGASCYVHKPNSLEEWCSKMGKLGKFWVECVKVAG